MKQFIRKHFLSALVVLSAILAYAGYHVYFIQIGEEASFLDIIYLVFQLFTFNSSFEPESINIYLNVSRFLAPASLATVIIREILNLFSNTMKKERARHYRNHYIFCGNCAGLKPLIEEQSALKNKSILVHREEDKLIGDLRILKFPHAEFTTNLLNRISFYDSKYVIISNQNDLHSIEYASSLIQSIEKKQQKNNIELVLIFNNPEWSELSNDLGLLERLNQQAMENSFINIRYINYLDRSIRKLLQLCPPDKYKPVLCPMDELPLVLITGFNELAKRLIIGLALNCHYLNHQKIKIFIHSDRELEIAAFIAKYQLEHMLDLSIRGKDALEKFNKKIDVSYLCDIDSLDLLRNLSLINRNSLLRPSHKIICRDECSLKEYLSQMVDHVFVAREETDSLSALIDESVDEMARSLHMNYLQARKDNRQISEAIDTHQEWENLSDEVKDRNRYPADHMLTKARAMNCELCDISNRKKTFDIKSFSYLEDLSEAEHRRWSAYMYFKGWRQGAKRDNDLKIHPDLIPYEQLDESSKQKDRDNILQLQELCALRNIKLVEIESGE